MKILLINPPKSQVNKIAQYAPQDLKLKISKIGLIGPPHALCVIAGNLRDFEVDILDLKAEYDLGLVNDLGTTVAKKISDFSPDIVGMTVITSDYNRAVEVLDIVKRTGPEILTVVGGIHPSLCPEDFKLPCVDIIIKGPGKKIFRDIVIAYSNKRCLEQIPNIIFKTGGKQVYTKRAQVNNEHVLSSVYADRSLVKKYDNAYKAGMSNDPVAFIETSIGCSSRCNFCAIWPLNNGNYFPRDVEDIVGELKTMSDYRVIRFVDANTTGDIEHCHRLFDRIIEEKLDKVIIMDIRSDTAVNHPELIEKAVRAGLKAAIIGMESPDDSELDFYNKQSSRDIVLRSIETMRKNDIHIRGVFIVQPDYGYENFAKLKDFTNKNGLTHSAFTVMTPVPGTALYSQMVDKIVVKNLDHYNFFNSVFETLLPEEEFYMHTAELFRDKQVRV